MSLTGALLAVSIQQWAQIYLQATQRRRNPRDRARIRAFYFEGIDNWQLRRVTRAVPTLVHVSLFLFFLGLPIFLFHVNLTVFNVVLSWLGLCLGIYGCITFMPVLFQDCPYSSPLSSTAWFFVTGTLYVVHQLLKRFTSRDHAIFRWYRTRYTGWRLYWPSLHEMQKVAEHSVNQLSSDIDYRALSWMFDTLNDDDEFEQFFDALPAICAPETLVDSQAQFLKPNENKLSHALIGMMDRTMLSDLVPESVKQRRIIIYTKVVTATSVLGPWWTLRRVLLGDWRGLSKFIQFGHFVQSWKNLPDQITAFYAQYVVAITMSGVQDRDESWFQLASRQLNASKSLLQNYYKTGDTILLVNVMFIIRRTVECYVRSTDRHRMDIFLVSSKALESLCKFDILQTFPEYHNEFCSLWNQLVNMARSHDYPHVAPVSVMILKSIRRLYIDLHRGTRAFPTAFRTTTDDGDPVLNDASSYPLCTVIRHLPSRPVPQLQLRNSISGAAGVNPRETASSVETSPNVLSPFAPALPSRFITPSSLPPPLIYTPVPLPQMAPTDSPYTPLGMVESSLGQNAHNFDRAESPAILPSIIPMSPSPTDSSMFPPPPHASSSQSSDSDSPPRHHHTQASTSVHQLRRPRDLQTGADASTLAIDFTTSALPSPTFQEPIDPALQSPDSPPGHHHAQASSSVHQLRRPQDLQTGADASTRTIDSTTSASSSPMFQEPTATASQSSGSPPGHHHAQPPSSVHQLRRPRDLQTGADASVQSDNNSGDGRSNRPFSVRFDGNVSDGDDGLRTPSPVARVEESGFSDISMEMTTPFIRSRDLAITEIATPQVLKFNEFGEYSVFLYHSPHTIVYEDELYPTAVHLFEARKFLMHRPDLADRIRQCERVEEVSGIGSELAVFTRRDWGNVALSIVSLFPFFILYPYLCAKRLFIS